MILTSSHAFGLHLHIDLKHGARNDMSVIAGKERMKKKYECFPLSGTSQELGNVSIA